MSNGDGLLRAIIDEPADDGLRLIYADWLEDHGQAARAEFVRLQIQLWNVSWDCRCGRKGDGHRFAGGQHHNGPCAADRLRVSVGGRMPHAAERVRRLFRDGAPSWWGGLPPEYRTAVPGDISIELASGWKFMVRRGFIAEVRCRWRRWCGEANFDARHLLVTGHPIQRVRLTDREPEQFGSGDVWRWSWANDTAPADYFDHKQCVPLSLWKLLPPDYPYTYKEYPSEQAARDALSVACLRLAGLTVPDETGL